MPTWSNRSSRRPLKAEVPGSSPGVGTMPCDWPSHGVMGVAEQPRRNGGGARLHIINRWYPSSRTCSNCGAAKAKLSLKERVYVCDQCGLVIDRDLNAAINLDVAGSAPETLNARGGRIRPRHLGGRPKTPCNPWGKETRTKRQPSTGRRETWSGYWQQYPVN